MRHFELPTNGAEHVLLGIWNQNSNAVIYEKCCSYISISIFIKNHFVVFTYLVNLFWLITEYPQIVLSIVVMNCTFVGLISTTLFSNPTIVILGRILVQKKKGWINVITIPIVFLSLKSALHFTDLPTATILWFSDYSL